MAASQQQKVDFLLKKIGYTASKTGLAEDSSLSGTKKAPFAEAVPSPLVIATSSVWADSEYIPATPPGSSSSYVQVYLSGTSGHHMTVDSTVSGNRAYIAYSTYNNSSTAILGDWIDTQFGASYIIKVYKGDPNSGGVSLSAAGSGSNDGWFFDYSSGILNFNDTNVPSGVTDSNIYVVGYRYIGGKGVLAPAGIGTFNSLEISGVSTFSAAIDANAGADISGGVGLNVVGHTELDEVNVSGVSTYGGAIDANAGILASTLKVEDLTATRVVLAGTGGEIEDNAKLTFTTDKLAVTGGLTVSAGATFAGIVDGNAGANISGGEATFASATVSDLTDNRVVIAGTSGALEDSGNLTFSGTKLTVTGNAQVTTDLDVDGGANISGGVGLNVVGHTEVDEVNVSGVSTYGGAIDANAGIDVSGHTELDNVNVSGVATYSAAADFNAGADISGGVGLNVVGHTELDEVNASGVSTFAALIDGNAGANISGGSGLVASTAKISDLTDNRVVLAGASGELEDSSAITFDGSTFAIVGGATFTGNVTVGGTLTSEDKTNVDSVGLITARTGVRITSGGLIVSSGVNTFTDAIDANGGANIAGGAGLVASSAKISDLTSGRVVVAGTDGELEDASTFTFSGGTVSATAFSGTNLTGTLQTAAQPNVTSLGTIANLVASRAQVTGVGGLVITGVSTFTGAVDANGGADISGGVGLNVVGHAELDEVNVSGVSTYAGAIDANAGAHISGGIGLEVVGHTEVDNFSASGVSTFAALVDGNAGANFSGAETVLSSATVSDLTENRIVIAGADGALEDASTLTFDGTKLQVGTAITMYQATGIVSASYFYGDGSNLLNAGSLLSASSGVQRIVTTSLTSGTMTSAGTDADLNFDTSSNTLNAGKVNVAGVGTFGGLVDGNAGCNFSGAESTFSSATVSDLTDERVVLAGTSGALEDSGNLTFSGSKLTVTGNAQVTTDLDVDGGANISGGVGLAVVGHTELDNLNVSGVSTYGGAADFNAGVLASTLKVEDLSGARVVVSGTGGEIEDSANLTWVSNGANYLGLTGGLTVSAASTFSGIVDGNAGANFSGAETTLSSATVSDLTAGRVVVAGTSGALEDASTFTFSGGTVSATAFSATDLTGTLQTAAQGNVTSLGTLTGLAVNGDLALHGPAGVSSVTWDKSDNALEFLDHAKAKFGTGGDLTIYHDGSHSYIDDGGAGRLFLESNSGITLQTSDGAKTTAKFNNAGAVQLYYDNAKKIESTFTGAIVTGILTATSFTGTVNTAAQTNITSVGTLTGLTVDGDASVNDKLIISDTIRHSGDANTKIRFPANDTFSVETGGSEAFRVDSSQRLLLGTTTATNNIRLGNKFGVVGTAAYTGMSISQYAGTTAAEKPMIDFNRSRGSSDGTMTSVAADDGLGEIIFRGSDGTDFNDAATIRAFVDGTPSDGTDMPGRLTFATSADGSATPTERLRIDSAGNMGLGITPDTQGATVDSLQIGSATNLYNETSDDYTILGNNVYFDGSDNKYIKAQESSRLMLNAGEFTFNQAGSGSADATITYTTPLKIDSTGRLMLGTTTEGHASADDLTVANSGDTGITIRSGTSNEGNIFFSDGTSGGDEYQGIIRFDHSDNGLKFNTTGSERLHLTTTGAKVTGILTATGAVDFDSTLNVDGVATFNSTVKVSDKIERLGDANTNIRFPGADTFSVETAGSESFRVDSGQRLLKGLTTARGNYGNNTSGVEYGLQVEGLNALNSTIALVRNSDDANDGGIVLGKTRAGAVGGNTVVQAGDDLGTIAWAGSDGTSLQFGAEILAEVVSGVGNDDLPADLIFKTNAGGTSTGERLRITSGGSLGIGITNPDANTNLYIKDSTVNQIKLETTDNTSYGLLKFIEGDHDGTKDKYIIAYNDSHTVQPDEFSFKNQIGDITFLAGGTSLSAERLRIKSDGKIGIGITVPTGTLSIASGTYQSTTPTSTGDDIVISGNQSLGIQFLTLASGTSNNNIYFGDTDDADVGMIRYAHADNSLQFQTNTAERLQITSNGRVLIGAGAVGASSNLVAQGGLQVSANGASGAPSLCIGADGTGANTQSLTDDTVKDCRIGYPNYDIDEEPLALISGFVGDGSSLDDNDGARIYIGGGTSYLNAVNQVRFYTQNTNIATVTGTERFRIGPDGTADFNENTVQKAVLKNYTETVKAVGNTGTSATLDLADGNVFTATLNGNCTFTFTTGTNSSPNAASFTLILTNDGSAGRTIAWPASVKWPNASAPSRTTAASKTDIWSFMTPDNGTTWYGNIALYNFS